MKHIMILLAVCLTAAACENDRPVYTDKAKVYLSGDPAQGAAAKAVKISFRFEDYTVQTYDINMVARIIGLPADRDRRFAVEVVETVDEKTIKTNVAPSDYTIGELIVPAGEYEGVVPITVNRTVPGLNLTDSRVTAMLTLRVVASDDFDAGFDENIEYSYQWCDYLVRPASWTSQINNYIGPFTQARFKFIIDVTGITDFTEFQGNYNKTGWLQSVLIKALDEYNSDPANEGRAEGWPYLNDNGQPLEIGRSLPY